MDVQLQDLIDKIKKDGVKVAEDTATKIENEAQTKASDIVADAQKRADDLLKNAKSEIARLEKSSQDAIAQACRNMLLTFRDSLTAQLDAFIATQTAKAYSSDMLKTLVPEVVKAWGKNKDADKLEVLLSEKDCKTLQNGFQSALKEQIAKGLEIRPDKTVQAGFRIGVNNGAAFYDYSAESVADLFASYLNPRIAAIMKQVAQKSE